MNIKEKLNEYDYKLIDLAKELKISRPTLNNYIVMYEEGNEIPNTKYQQVFNNLFGDQVKNKNDFKKALKRYHTLLERDDVLGVTEMDMKSTNLLSSVIRHIKKDLELEGYKEDVYVFINMLITSYREEEIFQQFVKYYLYLNNIKDISGITDEDKIFVSNYYKLMDNCKKREIQFDEEFYNLFLERISSIRNENIEKSKKKAKEKEEIIKEIFREKLDEKVKEQLKLGVDIDQINFDELIKNIDLNDFGK